MYDKQSDLPAVSVVAMEQGSASLMFYDNGVPRAELGNELGFRELGFKPEDPSAPTSLKFWKGGAYTGTLYWHAPLGKVTNSFCLEIKPFPHRPLRHLQAFYVLHASPLPPLLRAMFRHVQRWLFQGQGTMWNLSCTGWRFSGDLPRCRFAHRIGIEQDCNPHSGITGIRGDGVPRHVAKRRQDGCQVQVRHEGGRVVRRQPLPQRRG